MPRKKIDKDVIYANNPVQQSAPTTYPEPRLESSSLKFTGYTPIPYLNTKNVSSTYLKNDSQSWSSNKYIQLSIDDRMEAHKRKLGQDDNALTKHQRTIVLQPGSSYTRIGQAEAAKPHLIPSIIARKKRDSDVDMSGESSQSQPHLNTSLYQSTLSTISNDITSTLKMKKLETNPNAQSQVEAHNANAEAEVLPSHLNSSDHFIDADTPLDALPSVLVGEDVFKLTSNAKQHYDIKRPFVRGGFNTQDYSSHAILLSDIDTWLTTVFKNVFNFTTNDIRSLSVALIIPNIYTSAYLNDMANVILNLVGCQQILLLQEANATAFGCGMSSACVIDIGAQKTSVACVEEGVVIPESRIELAYGGDDVTLLFHQLLTEKGFPYSTDISDFGDWQIFDNLKQRACTLNEADLAVTSHDFIVRKPNQNSSKYSIRVYEDGLKAPMLLFYPQMVDFGYKHRPSHKLWGDAPQTLDIGSGNVSQAMQLSAISSAGGHMAGLVASKTGKEKEKGVAEVDSDDAELKEKERAMAMESSKISLPLAILNSIAATTTEERIKKFCSSLVITGGGGHMRGVHQAIEERLRGALHYVPQYSFVDRVQHIPPPKDVESGLLAWSGISTLSKLEVSNELWVGANDFNALGLKALRDRTYCLQLY